jgi:hypothetical protein
MGVICPAVTSAPISIPGLATMGVAVRPMIRNGPTDSSVKGRPVTRVLCPRLEAATPDLPSLAARAANQRVVIHGHSKMMTISC